MNPDKVDIVLGAHKGLPFFATLSFTTSINSPTSAKEVLKAMVPLLPIDEFIGCDNERTLEIAVRVPPKM